MAMGGSLEQSGIIPAAGLKFARRHAWSRGRAVRLVEFNIAAAGINVPTGAEEERRPTISQTSHLNNISGLPRTATIRVLTDQLDSKLVLRRRGRLLLSVDRPHSKEYVPKQVGPGCATDIADLRRRGRVKVPQNLRAAYVQPIVVIHVIHMAEETAVLAPAHQAEVRLSARLWQRGVAERGPIRDEDPAPTRREVTWTWNHVGKYGAAFEVHYWGQKHCRP